MCGPAAWKICEMILGFFLKVVELKRYSKNLVQTYPTKFTPATKISQNNLFGDASALRRGGMKKEETKKIVDFFGKVWYNIYRK